MRPAAAGLALALCAARPAATAGRPGQHDDACGLKSRDDHRGVDFMLPDFAAMERRVAALTVSSASTRSAGSARAPQACRRG